ncbi:hypothetical protein AVEN_35148-1 [Araneus ventricosus]|uniref:Uncharacterized protein n=1 Tax=Araneus ventricosus TaxID=182803 RepID=A0A4Y2HC29_ARAVE|nr:hypothetical protein AVEN_35148-1 [Araneus ventricosus]
MGFRSGDLAGHGICGMVSLSRQLLTNRALCGRALSSINIASVPIAAIKGPTKGCRISSLYRTAVTEPPANVSIPAQTSNLQPLYGLYLRYLAPDSVSLDLSISMPFGNRCGC